MAADEILHVKRLISYFSRMNSGITNHSIRQFLGDWKTSAFLEKYNVRNTFYPI